MKSLHWLLLQFSTISVFTKELIYCCILESVAYFYPQKTHTIQYDALFYCTVYGDGKNRLLNSKMQHSG